MAALYSVAIISSLLKSQSIRERTTTTRAIGFREPLFQPISTHLYLMANTPLVHKKPWRKSLLYFRSVSFVQPNKFQIFLFSLTEAKVTIEYLI